MREEIRRLQPDLLFLQEVHGEHQGHRKKIKDYPTASQFEFLAEEMWPHFRYGKNAVYTEGHHGNAVLSKFPIIACENINISQNRFEQRGILHVTLELPATLEPPNELVEKDIGAPRIIHALCAHLGLFERDRKRQLEQLALRVATHIPSHEAIIAAGDFNDWRKTVTIPLERGLQLEEAFMHTHGRHAKTFPSWFPILCLDRVYFRGFRVREARRLDATTWTHLSDHLALWVELDF